MLQNSSVQTSTAADINRKGFTILTEKNSWVEYIGALGGLDDGLKEGEHVRVPAFKANTTRNATEALDGYQALTDRTKFLFLKAAALKALQDQSLEPDHFQELLVGAERVNCRISVEGLNDCISKLAAKFKHRINEGAPNLSESEITGQAKTRGTGTAQDPIDWVAQAGQMIGSSLDNRLKTYLDTPGVLVGKNSFVILATGPKGTGWSVDKQDRLLMQTWNLCSRERETPCLSTISKALLEFDRNNQKESVRIYFGERFLDRLRKELILLQNRTLPVRAGE